MEKISDLRISKNMKYTALYTAMRFFETSLDIYEKKYADGTCIVIDAEKQTVSINGKFSFYLDSPVSFVKLEFINRILELSYELSDIGVDENFSQISFASYKILFLDWEDDFKQNISDGWVMYKSRLVSGVLEYKTKIKNKELYDYGLLEKKGSFNFAKKTPVKVHSKEFEIEENRLIKYLGKEKKVIVPSGIEEIESSAFWDNLYVEEVELPEGLVNMGGDTFYNCKNLKKVNIPSTVKAMGNNPFAGCPWLEIQNNSKNFLYENGILYSVDKTLLIYASIKGSENELVIPETVQIIGKHAFYLCERFEKITLPESLKKMENNPFSGCFRLELINHSKAYKIIDDVIYNEYGTAVIGALNKIKSKCLKIPEGVKSINRNSFWNCSGIQKIVFPKSLEDIGYNPFVACTNIHFESKSDRFKVEDGILYNKDFTKIICYPAWKAQGQVTLRDSVITLERGAFSTCENLTGINLRNVNIINKSCFTNCCNLEELYVSDLVTYIGEWAFAYCTYLKNISVKEGTLIDNNALSNCPAKIHYRKEASNYLFESDNLYTLTSMQKAYKGKVDSILIDPPYNSHIDYIGYKDGDYSEGYYNFISQRIALAYELLSEKGFLVINIDEGEVQGLTDLCKKYFAQNLVQVCKWKKLHPYFDVNRDVKPGKKVVECEYIIVCRKSDKAVLKDIMQPYILAGSLKEQISSFPEVFDCFGTTSSAKDEICQIFGRRDYFSTPKPVKLMKELIRATSSSDSIIMDFFAGSGTTGHACFELNSEDGGKRKVIMICNNESNICQEVTRKRMDYAAQKYNASFVFMN